MKTSTPFFYDFDHEEIQDDTFITGKYKVAFDYDEGRVFDIRVNVGLDMPQIWETVNLYSYKLYRLCEQHLSDIQTENY